MKIARLPDGRTIPFPMDTHDDEIDRVVRSMMGVQSEDDILKEQTSVALQQQVLQTLAQVSQMMMALVQATQENSAQISALQQTVAQAADAAVKAYTAPRVLVKSPDNKSATLQVRSE